MISVDQASSLISGGVHGENPKNPKNTENTQNPEPKLRQMTKDINKSKTRTRSQNRPSLRVVTSNSNSVARTSIPSAYRRVRNNNQPYTTSKISSHSSDPISRLLVYSLRMLILGVGLGAIAGTILSKLDLTRPLLPGLPQINLDFILAQNAEETQPETNSEKKETPYNNPNSSVAFSDELTSLKTKIEALATKYPKLQAGAFFVDFDNGAYVNVQGDTVFSAASTIKIPVLVAFLEDVDAGKIYLDEKLTIKEKAGGSGDMQYKPVGTEFTALETANKMIEISDNTATNMLIEKMGGAEALNQRFKNWGLENTIINNPLPDLPGTNTTSPKDLSYILARVNQGELLSLRSRDRLLAIMRTTRTRTLLPQGLESDALIAHKTGDIGTVLGDAGIVDMPTGKRYIGAVLVKRSHNDYTARTMIQEISRTAYQHFKWYLPRPVKEQN